MRLASRRVSPDCRPQSAGSARRSVTEKPIWMHAAPQTRPPTGQPRLYQRPLSARCVQKPWLNRQPPGLPKTSRPTSARPERREYRPQRPEVSETSGKATSERSGTTSSHKDEALYVRPLSAHAGRQAQKPVVSQSRPLSANAQHRLSGGVGHAEFERPATTPVATCSAEQKEYLQRLLVASASHRRGVPDLYGFGKVIGVGSFGTVRLAHHKLTGQRVAVKTYERSKMKDPQQWKRVQQEARVMERLSDCPLVCRFLEAFETPSPRRAHLVMEHLPGGSLCAHVKAKRKLTEAEAQPLMLQLATAIAHMHSLDVVHRDIKLENVLFLDDSRTVIRVIDFGFSTRCAPERRLRLFCGTPSYMPPEIVRRTEYRGKPIDLWSLGVVAYACVAGCFPFAARSQSELYRKILRGTFRAPDGLSPASTDFLHAAILVDVHTRITAPDARRHPWLVGGLSTSAQLLGTDLGLLTRSKNPNDDVQPDAINKITAIGVPRDVVLESIRNAEHSPITACYYLHLATTPQRQKSTPASTTAS